MSNHIQKRLQNIASPLIGFVVLIAFTAGMVYAATSFSATGGGNVTQVTTNWGDCRNITNTGQALFVPANTIEEWDSFLNNAPHKTVDTCVVCDPGTGNACNSSPNTCGQTSPGTIQCNGSCDASIPANPAGYGDSCTSGANSCGQTSPGTITCSGTCSAKVPANPAGYGNYCTSAANSCGQTNPGSINCSGVCSASVPANPAGYGNFCTSAANSCGQTNSGTITCSGTCSASVPSDSLCPPPLKYYTMELGSNSSGPELLTCTVTFNDGSTWVESNVWSGPPSYYGPHATAADATGFTCTVEYGGDMSGDYYSNLNVY